MANDTFLGTINEFILITIEIIEKLNEELDWINSHHGRCIAAKKVGTATSVTGSAILVGSLILAPFTGGASLAAAAGYGVFATAAGAGINLGTSLADMITRRIEKGQIEDICARRNQVANRLQEYFDELERVAMELKALNVEEERAYLLSLRNIISKGTKVRASAAEILKLSESAQVTSGTSNMLLRNEDLFWKKTDVKSKGLMKSLAFFGFNVSKEGAIAVLRSSATLLNGAFAIYDVYSLIQDVKNNHPTANAISEMIKQMKEELAQIGELKEIAIAIE